MDASYIECADKFTAEASTALLPAEPTPTLTTTEKRSTEVSTAPLPAEPTPTPTTAEKEVIYYVLVLINVQCLEIEHSLLINSRIVS